MQRQGLEISVAELPCDLERPPQLLLRRVDVPSCVRGDTAQAGEVPVLDAFGLVLEQARGSLRPAGGDRTCREQEVAASESQSDPRGACAIVIAQVAVERAFARVDAPFGGTGPGGRLGDQLQVARRELRRL